MSQVLAEQSLVFVLSSWLESCQHVSWTARRAVSISVCMPETLPGQLPMIQPAISWKCCSLAKLCSVQSILPPLPCSWPLAPAQPLTPLFAPLPLPPPCHDCAPIFPSSFTRLQSPRLMSPLPTSLSCFAPSLSPPSLSPAPRSPFPLSHIHTPVNHVQ